MNRRSYLRDQNPRWKGGQIVRPDGRVMIYSPGHPRATGGTGQYVFRYVLAAEQMLGRPLAHREIVHHKNGIPDDDRPENLEVTTQAEHASQHMKEYPRDALTGRILPRVTFDSSTHSYRLDGREIPGIHRISQAIRLTDPTIYPTGAAERGHYVEEAVYLDIKGQLDETSCPSLMGYVRAWRTARKALRIVPKEIEKLVANHRLAFATRIDILAFVDGEVVPINLKSGQPEPFHALQAAAEILCFASTQARPKRALYLHLSANETYLTKWYGAGKDGRRERNTWRAACTLYDWMQRSHQSVRPRAEPKPEPPPTVPVENSKLFERHT